MPDIALRHRQGRFALDVEFSIANQWTVIFGPSGSGKTTLLRVIAGLTTPDSGRIQLNNRLLLDTDRGVSIPASRRSIGLVSQQPALFPHLTARENVAFGIHRQEPGRRAARVLDMLRFFGADALADQPATQLSGGERKRVALARALAPAPQFLLLDEPLAGLDDASARDILSRLLALDIRVLYVSHDIAEIWRMPADVVVLEAGRVTAIGSLREVLAPNREHLLAQLR